MRLPLLVSCALLCILATTSFGQDSNTPLDKAVNFPTRFLDKVDKETSAMESRLMAYSEKALKKLEKQEEKMRRKLAKKDSLAAVQVFGDVKGRYQKLRQQLHQKENQLSRFKQYIPGFDTLKTSLNFLSQNPNSFFNNNQQLGQLKDAMESINGLEGKLQNAESIRAYIRERRQQLMGQLDRFGMVEDLKKYNKEVYYYAQQLKEYKTLLNDPDKMERKALSLLQKLPAVQQFFKEHSELADLFRVPDDYGTPQSLQGLQTRADIQSVIQQRVQSGGPNAQNIMQQNMAQAQQQLSALKEKVKQFGGSSGDDEMPDFKPNNQKTKTFWQRIEYGTDIQNTRSNNFYPTTTDLGLSIGYKINDKSIIGIGASYKMGWGKDFNNIAITNEGAGLRSYIDWKIKGSIYLSGGYEQNYRSRFENFQQLRRTPESWTQSGLLGLNKKYSIGKKWKGDIKLLYDFLYKSHSPQTQPVLFRMGYQF